MAEYINRRTALDALYDADAITYEGLDILEKIPAADIQPVKHGKWEVGDISYRYPSGVHYCSVCDYIDPFSTGSMHYCPNCGAKMDGVTDD